MRNEGPSINAASWFLFGLALVAVLVRCGGLQNHRRGFWWDDFVMIVSVVLFLATCIVGDLALSWGCGKHSGDVKQSDLPRATMMGIVAAAMGIFTDSMPKLGIALLITRMFGSRLWIKWTMLIASGMGIIFNTLLLIFAFVQCDPVRYQWHRDTMHGTCWKPHIFSDYATFVGAWDAALDIGLSVYPVLLAFKLDLRLRVVTAIGISTTFGLATSAVTIYKVSTKYHKFLHPERDQTRELADVILLNAIEASFTIIAGSVTMWGWVFSTDLWHKTTQHLPSWLSISNKNKNPALTKPEMKNPWEDRLQQQIPPPQVLRPISRMSRISRYSRVERFITFPQRAHWSGGSNKSASSNPTYNDNESSHVSADAPRSRRQTMYRGGAQQRYDPTAAAINEGEFDDDDDDDGSDASTL